MKNLLKPFSYTLVASAIAMAFNQPVFASNIQNNTAQQQSRNLNKNKGKPATNLQQQNKKSATKTNSVKGKRSEIEGIAYEQKIAFQKSEEQRKQAEAIAIAQVKQEQQRRLAEEQKKAQEEASLIAREYQEAKRVAQQQEIARQQVEEARQQALAEQRKKQEAARIEHEREVLEQQLAHKKAEEIARQRAAEEQHKQAELARVKNEMIAREQEVARQKIEAAALQKAIDEQRKKAEVARIKRELIIREQDLVQQDTNDKLRQQAIEEQRQKEEQARIEQQRLEAERIAREQEIARQKAEEARKKSEEMARRERERLAREQEIARQKAEEEDRQRALEDQRRKEEAARIEREHQEAERVAREEKLAKQKAEEERKQAEETARIEQQRIEAERVAREQEIARQKAEEERKQAEEAARIEQQRVEAERVAREQEIARQKAEEERKQAEETARIEQQRIEAERVAREQEIARQKAEEERKQAEEVNQIAKAQDAIPEMGSDGEILSAEQHPEITETVKEVQSVSVQPESEGQTVNELVGNKQPTLMVEESTAPTNDSPENTQTEAGIIEDVALEAQLPPELLRAGEALTVQLSPEETPQYNEAQQTQALANRQKEMATANAMVSDMSIITALNLDLAGRMDRRLDRTNFYRPLGGVWVEYANNDVHAHNGDYRNYRSKSSQITLGNDEAELDNGVILGGTLTHAKNSNKYGSLNGSGHLTMLTAYAKQNFDEYSKAIDISYGWSSSKIADSKFKRKIISIGMNFAYDFEFDDFKVTPIWGLRYHRVSATGGEVNGITVRSPSLSLVAYHAGVKISSTFDVEGLEVTPSFSSYYVTTLGKSYGQNINGQEFQQKVGTYFYNDVSLGVGIQDWKVSAYAGFNHGKHGEKQNQLGVKLNYYW
jgi:autotransporter adhesin